MNTTDQETSSFCNVRNDFDWLPVSLLHSSKVTPEDLILIDQIAVRALQLVLCSVNRSHGSSDCPHTSCHHMYNHAHLDFAPAGANTIRSSYVNSCWTCFTRVHVCNIKVIVSLTPLHPSMCGNESLISATWIGNPCASVVNSGGF